MAAVKQKGPVLWRYLIAAGFWVGLSPVAIAHPHIFVDAAIEVIFDDQSRATGLRITGRMTTCFR